MAFLFTRQHKHRKTYYVGHYADGRFVRRKIGRLKVLAEKAKGEIEAKIERGDAGLLKKDYLIQKFFDEYFERTRARHSPSYQQRNKIVIENFRRFLKAQKPHLTKLSQVTPAVVGEYQGFRLSERTGNGDRPVRKRTVREIFF